MSQLQNNMSTVKKIILMMVVFSSAFAFAQDSGCASKPATTQPETKPRIVSTKPQEQVTPQARAILDKLQQTGEKIHHLRADITYKVVNATLGDSEVREGWVCFRRGDNKSPDKKIPAAFRTHFETLQQARGPRRVNRVDYAYDGQWLTVAKQATKTVTRYQVTDKADTSDSMTLGKGPFPLPFGQKADEMIRYFECTTREARKFDPPETDYIKLVPRKQYKKDFAFTYAHMWIASDTGLPVKILSMDTSKNRTTVLFTNVKTPDEIASDMFRLKKPAGWKLIVKRLESGDSLAP